MELLNSRFIKSHLHSFPEVKVHVKVHPHPLRFHSKTKNVNVNLFLSKLPGLEKSLNIIKAFKITWIILTEQE